MRGRCDGGLPSPLAQRRQCHRFYRVRYRRRALNTRFILIEPSHAGNVGAVARAMKVMGFDDLVLVRPRWPDVLSMQETVQRASGAHDVLAAARVAPTLAEAAEGVDVLCATAMTPRDFGPPTRAPREYLTGLAVSRAGHQGVAFVMGGERHGLSNDDVYRCHVCLSIPTAPDYGSLNLAAAVQVLTYEWRAALGGFAASPPPVPSTPPMQAMPADAAAVQGMLTHLEQALVAVGYLDPATPRKLLPRLNQLFNRAQPTPEEIHILRGVAKSMIEMARKASR